MDRFRKCGGSGVRSISKGRRPGDPRLGSDRIQADARQRQRGKVITEEAEGLVLTLVAPTCSALKQVFSSLSETEVRLLQGESS